MKPQTQNDITTATTDPADNSDDIIGTIKDFVAIPSTVDRPEALRASVDFIADMLAVQPAITVERFEQNGKPSLLAYYGTERPTRFDVILHGHTDVVPADDAQFIPRIEEGRLYGRGVYDMKAAMVIMTEIFRTKGQQSPLKLGLQVVCDEETGGYDCVTVQLADSVKADFVITGEMTDNKICNETRGLCWTEVTLSGKRAHGGYVWHGENALAKVSDLAQKVLECYPTPLKQEWCTTANIAAISTDNETFNIVPDQASVKIDFRFTPEDEHFRDRDSVIAFIRQFAPDAEISFQVFEPAVYVPESNSYLLRLEEAYQSVTGQPAELIKRYASSDARHYALLNTPCVEFGPVGASHHADDEFLEIASLEPFAAALELFIASSGRTSLE